MDKTTALLGFLLFSLFIGVVAQLMPKKVEGFMQKPVGAPIGDKGIGPYDNVSLDGGFSGFLKNEIKPAGTSSTGDIMFLVGNKVDESCCPGAFNTDTGCICLTQRDRHTMMMRGGNR